MAAEPKSLISREAYLAMERASEERHEYVAGEVFIMPSGSHDHALILGNLIAAFHRPMRDRGYWFFSRDLRLALPAADTYTYADASIVCGRPQLEDEHRDNLLNPAVIIEVLSPLTASGDRAQRFARYRSIPTFREYLLISQDAPLIEHHVRQDDRRWLRSTAEGVAASVILPSLGYTLALGDIYDGIAFDCMSIAL